jgi:CheY-like chemotaxis protein
VLVAEDNMVNQMVAMGFLEELGYDAHLAADGREALLLMEKGVYDAVLMDCHMPEMDGFQATRELRRREPSGRRTPVIAMTAGVLDEDRERCLAAGMDDFVAKPVDLEDLRSTLARWTGRGA